MKQRLTSREWEELKALGRLEHLGADRRDVGLAKAIAALLLHLDTRYMAADLKLNDWLPNPQPEEERTVEQEMRAFEAFSVQHNRKFNGFNCKTIGQVDA